MIVRGGWEGGSGGGESGGWGGMLTFVWSASITWRKRHMLRMLSYDRQGGWRGVGGDVNVRVERFHHVTEEAHVAYVVVWSSGGVGGVRGGMLTFVSSASVTLRKRHMLHMLSYDRQGGVGGMLTFVSSTSFTLQKRLPLLTSCIVWRAFCGFPAWTYVGRGRILFIYDQGWNPQLCLDLDGSLHTSAEDIGKESAAGFKFVVLFGFINVDAQ